MFLSEKVLMVEPRGFAFNAETSADNFFQNQGPIKVPAESALKEFQELKKKLMRAGIMVNVFSPGDNLMTPDSVFPNNWFSTTPEGELFLYPMMAQSRRKERRKELIEKLKINYSRLIDLTNLEDRNLFLEGTGSLVLDHEHKIAYASLSKRTSEEAVREWNKSKNYELVLFTSFDQNSAPIYHTNVMMMLGDGFSIVCLEAIRDEKQRVIVRKRLEENGVVFQITLAQMQSFCGNSLALKNSDGEKFLIMSAQAYAAFTEKQKSLLIRHATIIYSGLTTIETIGGGSARCMIAELF